ncbi:ABC transporter ATP-binding protein [Rhodospirillum sp. A1_3_36]|uniref:ABC transporter ATP-binding protein n=1 Tax=Rhodospirillum sp. A1_3_36 TaxID=3391666 RepID=UPI0039A56C5C
MEHERDGDQDPVIVIDGLVSGKGDRFQVQVRDFTVSAGETVAIVGKSGSGKSTILDTVAGILRPLDPGHFHVGGGGRPLVDMADLWKRDDRKTLRAVRARHVGYVLQTGGLAPFLSIAENISLPLWRDGGSDIDRVRRLMAVLGIAHLERSLPRHVSVGERQRAAIARALVSKPDIVLADEPTASLDGPLAESTMSLLTGLARADGIALVLVTHDQDLARRHGFHIVHCRSETEGRSVLKGEGRA